MKDLIISAGKEAKPVLLKHTTLRAEGMHSVTHRLVLLSSKEVTSFSFGVCRLKLSVVKKEMDCVFQRKGMGRDVMRKIGVSEKGPEKFWGQSAIFALHICKEYRSFIQ